MKDNAITTQPEQNNISGFLSVIERAASNPAIDVEKMSRLMDMQERILNKRAESEFNAAMSRLVFPPIKHMSAIKHKDTLISTYTKYEDIDPIIRPIYAAEGFSVSFNTQQIDDGKVKYMATISHKDGHSRTSEMVLPSDTSGAKNAIQAIGSTISYAKRYLVCMSFNIVTTGEDDDGKSSSGTISIEEAASLDLRLRSLGEWAIPNFLKWAKVEQLTQIKSSNYKAALNAITATEQEQAKKAKATK